jgi:hypothetical protein
MKDIYFLFFLVLTGVGSSIMTLYAPTMVAHIKRLFTRKKRTPQPDCSLMEHNIEVLVERVNDLEEQLTNVVEAKYTRDRNRKNNIRRDVREYLKELQND